MLLTEDVGHKDIRYINTEQSITQQQFTLKQYRLKNKIIIIPPHAMMPHSRNNRQKVL